MGVTGLCFTLTFMLFGVFGSFNFLFAVGGFLTKFDFNPRLKLIVDKLSSINSCCMVGFRVGILIAGLKGVLTFSRGGTGTGGANSGDFLIEVDTISFDYFSFDK